MITIEAAGDLLLGRGVGKQITCELFDGELVERHIAVEGVDHPFAPAGHVAAAIDVVTVGVCVARGVEPVEGETFAVVWRGQEMVDKPLVASRLIVGEISIDFREGRRQAGEVEREPTDQRRFVRLRRRL